MVNLHPFQNRRIELDLTYEQVAKRSDCSASTVHRWLTGQSEMSIRDVVALAHALRISFPEVVENLKNSVEGRAIAAEYRREQRDRNGTIRTRSSADGRCCVDEYRKARASA
ncbi:helix-turn-helix domain-containing protein [Streptomyces chrestomyceticus]|uniref:helix-turn-helix domain-containing protein n=1 Tax=Streptomyces chrestomyceticus TaxID=68185 RepID=UPI0035A88FB4